MRSLSRDHHIYVLEPEAEPAITIDSGEELMVETWDAFEGVRDPAVIDARYLKGPATGPIYVNGAEPGDAPRLAFISITPNDAAAPTSPPGLALPGWDILSRWLAAVTGSPAHDSAAAVFNDIAQKRPAYAGLSFYHLGTGGAALDRQPETAESAQ